MVQQITKTDLEQIGMENKEIDRYLNLVNLMKRTTKINL